ncbi:hypothetical protein [Actinokineospora sp. NPDC004072]
MWSDQAHEADQPATAGVRGGAAPELGGRRPLRPVIDEIRRARAEIAAAEERMRLLLAYGR